MILVTKTPDQMRQRVCVCVCSLVSVCLLNALGINNFVTVTVTVARVFCFPVLADHRSPFVIHIYIYFLSALTTAHASELLLVTFANHPAFGSATSRATCYVLMSTAADLPHPWVPRGAMVRGIRWVEGVVLRIFPPSFSPSLICPSYCMCLPSLLHTVARNQRPLADGVRLLFTAGRTLVYDHRCASNHL